MGIIVHELGIAIEGRAEAGIGGAVLTVDGEGVIPAHGILVHVEGIPVQRIVAGPTIVIEVVVPAAGTVEHAISIAEKVIGTTPAIKLVTAHGVLVHLEGIAVESIVAVSTIVIEDVAPTIEGVVPAVSMALHNHGIAVEDVVTSEATDGLRSSSVGQRATAVAKQAIGT